MVRGTSEGTLTQLENANMLFEFRLCCLVCVHVGYGSAKRN